MEAGRTLIFDTPEAARDAARGAALAGLEGVAEGAALRLPDEAPPRYRKRPELFVPEAADAAPLCPGCPLRGLFYVLSKLWLRVVAGEGCALLAAQPPLRALDAAFGGRAAVPALCGFLAAMGPEARRDTVAVTDAGSFSQSALAPLLAARGVVLVTDTGGEARGGLPAAEAAPEAHCAAAGLPFAVCDPFDPAGLEAALRAALAAETASALVCRAPCALLSPGGGPPYAVDADRCRACGACLRLGCPAVGRDGRRARIDPAGCAGCGLCLRVCPCAAVRPAGGGR